MPARKKKDGRWMFRKVVQLPDGTKRRISGVPAINTKMDAERAERTAIAEALAPKPREVSTFERFVWDRYMPMAEIDLSPSEYAAKKQKLKLALLPQMGHRRLDEIGRAELDALKLSLSGKAPRTINNYLATVGAILGYAVELGIIAKQPRLGIVDVPPQDFEVYSDEEIDLLLAACSTDYERAAILLGADAGLRAGEMVALWRTDIGQRILVQRSDWYGQLKAPKSGKARRLPISTRLGEALERCKKLHLGKVVLARPDGSPWTYEVQRAVMKRLSEASGVENRGWHALRHAFGSRLAAKGVPARVIQDLMGHASITTTERYMHLAPGADDIALAALNGGTVVALGSTDGGDSSTISES